MIAATSKLFTFFSPTKITGPIFEKELRVSSRHKRTYFLRFAYLLGFIVFIAIVWAENISYAIEHLYGASYTENMAAIGKLVVTYVSWFQFYTIPVLAVVLLSSSISSEIQARTIGVLVSTPISSFQIVMGKMLSKLYQLILLMAISVPILSIVRVFGGVQLDYILSTFCVSLTLTIFAASVSLFLSIYIKKAFAVIPLSIILILLVFGIIYWVFEMSLSDYGFDFGSKTLASLNPHLVMTLINDDLYYVKIVPANRVLTIWMSHCSISLLISAILLFVASLKVRKVALMQVTGEISAWKRWLNTESKPQKNKNAKPVKEKPIRSVSDNPVIWREARSRVFVKRKFLRIAMILFVSIGSVAAFFGAIFAALMNNGEFLGVIASGFMVYGAILTVIYSASCIPAEKESRSWILLMSTPLSEWQILAGKFVGIVRKCVLPWTLLLMFVIFCIVLTLIHPVTILFLMLNMISVVALLGGSGLLFGAIFRNTNSAVVCNILFAVSVWLLIPVLLTIFWGIARGLDELFLTLNPFMQASVVMSFGNFRSSFGELVYRWPADRLGVSMTLLTITISTVVHVSVGVFLATLAKIRLRNNIFYR